VAKFHDLLQLVQKWRTTTMYHDKRETLINDLRSAEANTRLDAAQQLRRYDDEAVIGALIESLADTELNICQMAMDSLTAIGGPALSMLMEALHHDDSGVRTAAALTLGDLGEEQAVHALIDALNDESVGVQDAAAESLNRIGTGEALAAVARWRD
jgi:HEAT repeat protein